MGKNTSVELDDRSLEILKKVDSVHRNSIVNLGIHMISKTPYYKGLTEDVDVFEDVVDLNKIQIEEVDKKDLKSKETETPKKGFIDIGFDDF